MKMWAQGSRPAALWFSGGQCAATFRNIRTSVLV